MTLPLIDHLALRVRDVRRSRTFYEQALEPFGVKVVESSQGPGFAIEGGGDFWIGEGEPPAAPVHVAFAAADRATVDKFHRAALEAGGRDNGAPGLRPNTTPGTTQRSSSIRTGTTSKPFSTGSPSCQPRDARLRQRAGMSLEAHLTPSSDWRLASSAARPRRLAARLLVEPLEEIHRRQWEADRSFEPRSTCVF